MIESSPFEVHAEVLQPGHLLGHDGLGQTELRDAVHQHAAHLVQRLEHGDVVPLPGQVAGAGQAGGAGAHHSHLVEFSSCSIMST